MRNGAGHIGNTLQYINRTMVATNGVHELLIPLTSMGGYSEDGELHEEPNSAP